MRKGHPNKKQPTQSVELWAAFEAGEFHAAVRRARRGAY
jgi:hypothetical protein